MDDRTTHVELQEPEFLMAIHLFPTVFYYSSVCELTAASVIWLGSTKRVLGHTFVILTPEVNLIPWRNTSQEVQHEMYSCSDLPWQHFPP